MKGFIKPEPGVDFWPPPHSPEAPHSIPQPPSRGKAKRHTPNRTESGNPSNRATTLRTGALCTPVWRPPVCGQRSFWKIRSRPYLKLAGRPVFTDWTATPGFCLPYQPIHFVTRACRRLLLRNTLREVRPLAPVVGGRRAKVAGSTPQPWGDLTSKQG